MPENTAKRTTGRTTRRIRLTDANASRFRPGESEYTVRDTKTPSLGIRIKPSGYRAWVYHGSVSGSPRRHSLGPVGLKTVEDARLKCLEIGLKEQISGALDETVKMAVPKFRDFVEGEWKTARYDHLKPSGRKGVDSALKTQLLPNFGTLPLDRITRSRVNRWFDQYSRSAPGGANHALDTLSGILNHAIVCGHIAINSTRGVRRNPRRKMTRFLSREEIRRLHAVLDACMAECPVNAPTADIIRLLLLTGCRRGEILNLQWREVGEDILELVDSKTGPGRCFSARKQKPSSIASPGWTVHGSFRPPPTGRSPVLRTPLTEYGDWRENEPESKTCACMTFATAWPRRPSSTAFRFRWSRGFSVTARSA